MVFEEFHYAGVGARDTPKRELIKLTDMASYLEDEFGAILRSGNAEGADQAFQKGAIKMQVFLPWASFQGGHPQTVPVSRDIKIKTLKVIAKLHDNPRGLSNSSLLLHSRNTNIVAGKELTEPAEFMLYWNFLNKRTGGTWMACKMADYYNVPRFNMASWDELEQFKLFLKARQEACQQ